MKLTKALLITFLLLLSNSIMAQLNFDIDSLLTAYKKHDLDTAKVITTNKIINYYMYRSPTLAKRYAFEQLDISNRINFSGGKSMANYQLGILYNNISNVDSARYHYQKALEFAKIYNNYIFISQAYHGLALLELEQGNLDVANNLNNKNLEYNFRNKDSVGIAYSLDFKGRINENKGHYQIALQNVLESLKLLPVVSTPINKNVRIADAKNHLANIEFSLGNYETAIDYNNEALEIYVNQNDTYYQAVALADLGKLNRKIKKYQKSEGFLKQSISKAEEANVPSIKASGLGELGGLYIAQKRYKKGFGLLNESISIAEKIGSERRACLSKMELIKGYNQLGQSKKALYLIDDVITYATKNGSLSILRDAFYEKSIANGKMKNLISSFEDYKQFTVLKDSMFNKENSQKIEELRIIYETEKKEAEIALQEEEIKTLNQEVEISNLKKGLYAGGAVAGIALSGLLFFGFRQRMKKNKIEREKQEEIYKQEIEFKKKELASQTLHLVQKNSFLTELKENLEKLKSSPDKFKMEFKRLVMLLKKESSGDKDWEVFKSYFAEVHDNFDNKLKSVYTDISEKEIRLASFLKMNLSTKEIADMLNVLPDSVLKSKYRLKKKLNLDKETDLYNYLSSL